MLIRVKVFPNSKKEEIIKKSNDSFRVFVKEKPIKGLANRRVIKVLTCHFNIPQSRIRLIKGFKQKNKIFEVSKN